MAYMSARKEALEKVIVGDIIHAEGSNGGSLICLVTRVTETHIEARTVTHQICLSFDIERGVARVPDYGVVCTIDSIAPLPKDVYDALVGLDERYRTRDDPESTKVLPHEKRAFLFVATHYRNNPLED